MLIYLIWITLSVALYTYLTNTYQNHSSITKAIPALGLLFVNFVSTRIMHTQNISPEVYTQRLIVGLSLHLILTLFLLLAMKFVAPTEFKSLIIPFGISFLVSLTILVVWLLRRIKN